jgi:hypothetical protein
MESGGTNMDEMEWAEWDRTRTDRIDVADLILRERLARDNHDWERMASLYHPDSVVDISWFRGTGAEFAKQSSVSAVRSMNFHVMTPPVVDVRGDRAISETPCILRGFSKLNSTEISFEGFVHLFWRAVRDGRHWLLSGLRIAYKVDMFHAREPDKPPHLDEEQLKGYRAAYRYMMVNLANDGLVVRDDLNGFDRPETVSALRTSERSWLAEREA